jgi:hypothetical protein
MNTTFATRIKNAARAAVIATALGAAALGLAGTANAELYGNPNQAAPYWQHQELDNCVLMATADMVGEVTGEKVSEFEITAVATVTPSVVHPGTIYVPPIGSLDDPNQGMGTDPVDVLVLLQHYDLSGKLGGDLAEGMKDKFVVKTGMEAIAQYLKEGHKVMAIVNAQTIWGDTDGPFDKANHALVVTGIDTDKGIVHLNDSGNPKGRDYQVKIATFEKAWATSGQSIVVTDQTS